MYFSNEGQTSHFRQGCYKEFFQKYSCKWDKSSARLLDFSGGAVIFNYICAAPHVAEIVHSAYTEGERKEIELWKNNDEDAHNWIPYIKYVTNEIEGLEDCTAWQEREALLRSKVKVVSCNIYDEPPISPTEKQAPFSVMCTSLALEAACKTHDDFNAGIKKLVKLLRLGGYLTILFVEDETFYMVGEDRFAVLPLSLAQVKRALEEAGCVVLMSERDPTPINRMENPTLSDHKACLFVAAYKVKE